LTRPLLDLKLYGDLLLLLALPLTFAFRRVAATMVLLACILLLPLYLYFTAPGPFRWVFRGQRKITPHASFVWDWWSVVGIASLAVAAFVCVRSLVVPSARTTII
jgi:hypothetical protein